MRKQKSVQRKVILLSIIFVSLAFLVLSLSSVIAAPYGAGTVTQENSTRAPADAPQSNEAYAGNVTELTIAGFTTTAAWQGYFGNVTGVIQLADSDDKVMYNWSSANPRGEVYASTNDTIEWLYIQCFNHTAAGNYSDDTANAGGTSKFGTNYTQLESMFGITSDDDADSVDITFASNNHALFYTNSFQFSAGECMNVKLFNSTGVGNFDEALMYEPTTHSVIFNSIINRNADGFDGRTHDFQMVVLENGHGTDLDTTTYYFYIELGA